MIRIEVPRFLLIGSENGEAQIYAASHNINECLATVAKGGADWHGIYDRLEGDVIRGKALANELRDYLRNRDDDRAHDEWLRQAYGGTA